MKRKEFEALKPIGKPAKVWNGGFTEACYKTLQDMGLNDAGFNQIANTVSTFKRGKYTVDACDNFCTVAGTPLSFLRDWSTGNATVMLLGEAKALDARAAKR